MQSETRYTQARNVTLLGGLKNIILSILKIIFGMTGHSHALIADGIHSLSDLLIDGLVLIASHFGSKAADENHPYGHGRIETAAIVLLGFILAIAGIGIIYDASKVIVSKQLPVRPDFYVLLIAVFSVLFNEVLYWYTKRIAKQINSQLLNANAWHHRSDSASSLIVVLGTGAAWLGFGLYDAIAAIIVGLMIIKMAWQFCWHSLQELVDTALDDSTVEKIKAMIISVPGVRALHHLRTRSVGGAVFCDLHILVDPKISVSEGHFIGQQVNAKLLKNITKVQDVTVHVDPEDDDDESNPPSGNLPTRAEIVELLTQRWQQLPVLSYIDAMFLHYLNGKLSIELYLPLNILSHQVTETLLTQQLQQSIADVVFIKSIKLYFHA